MAIEKYTTAAFVVDMYDQGEHDRVYKLFTREFGMIFAHAKSIRKLESKLRAHMLPRSVTRVTVVQGKETWRLVGAEENQLSGEGIFDVVILLKRFVRGGGAHTTLYDRLIQFLMTSKGYDIKLSRTLLYYIVLVELGYADAKVLGVKDIKEYTTFNLDDLYTYLLLSYNPVRIHIQDVMKEMQL